LRHAITFGSDPEDVFVVLAGETTVGGFEAYLGDLVSDPRWRPGMNVLIDLTALDSRKLTEQDLARIAALLSRYRTQLGPGRRAQVATDPLSFGLTRMVQAQAEAEGVDFSAAVFRSREEARAWLRPDHAGYRTALSAGARIRTPHGLIDLTPESRELLLELLAEEGHGEDIALFGAAGNDAPVELDDAARGVVASVIATNAPRREIPTDLIALGQALKG
jgi:hypothetical protein